MKIRRLTKLNGYRIFKNFRWSADLPDFARFNVIYGWNGAGKTSLSNLFRHIQRREQLTEGQVGVLIDQTEVTGSEFNSAVLPAVRVFNRDAIDRAIFELADQQFPPVFFLGEDSVEKQKKIESLKTQLDVKIEEASNWSRKKSEAANALEAFCSEEAKGIKNLLTVAGGGPFNNYNAANFKADVQRLASTSSSPQPLSEMHRRHCLAMKDSKAMAVLSEPFMKFPDFADLTARTQAMLGRSILSSVIAELVDNPAVAGWVNAGLSLHSGELASNKCRFCDQPLPDHRIKKIEAHFNDEFKRFQLDLDTLTQEIVSAKNFIQSLQIPPKEALYENLRPEYDKATQTLKGQAGTVQMSFDVLLKALHAKRDEPFKMIELRPFITSDGLSGNTAGKVESFFQIILSGIAALGAAMGKTAFEQLKALIAQHNQHTNKFDAEVKIARAELAQNEVLKALPEWHKKSDALSTALTNFSSEKEASEKLRNEIAEYEIQIRQHRRPAQELNEEMAAYLGRDELHFEVEQNGYRITRSGQPALNLSDGERTAIAFLYFLKSLQGTDFDIKTGIVVIDDPVSSLDANSLFSAFSFLKNRTSSAGQLFVLTHNFTFFRQVRNWYYNLPGQKKANPDLQPARFYMLVASVEDGQRAARLQLLDPFLHQYESEYHYLFKRIHQEAHKGADQSIENYYAIPNIARRLLESFLAFRVPNKSGELYQKLEAVQYDAAKKTRILRFLHTYSHFDQVAEPDHDPSIMSETPAILQDVLALIQGCDPEHFRCMNEMMVPAVQVE